METISKVKETTRLEDVFAEVEQHLREGHVVSMFSNHRLNPANECQAHIETPRRRYIGIGRTPLDALHDAVAQAREALR